ncbi:MAG: hypothetical protein KBD03_00555 [Gammaproteobacteria bacterium]|jgi:hypothetical protein|nr:hypothetical protein [Gammaproteobacteria bacterium]
MKVRCKKFLSEDRERKELDSRMGLTKEKEYIVLGISFSEHNRRIYMHDDDEDELPGYFDIRQFDIVSNYVPSNWVVEYNENFDNISFYPRSWIEAENFWDRFIDDDDPEMIALFEKEKELIYREEAEYGLKQRDK